MLLLHYAHHTVAWATHLFQGGRQEEGQAGLAVAPQPDRGEGRGDILIAALFFKQ